jgi:hypothetical protein
MKDSYKILIIILIAIVLGTMPVEGWPLVFSVLASVALGYLLGILGPRE